MAVEGDLGVARLGVEEADGAVVVPDRHHSVAHLDPGDFRLLHRVCLVNLQIGEVKVNSDVLFSS